MRSNEILPVGVKVKLREGVSAVFSELRAAGFRHCQIGGSQIAYMYGSEGRRNTRDLLNGIEGNEMTVTSVFMSFPNQVWSFEQMRSTVGLVPEEFRAERIAIACRTGTWAKEIGVDELVVHAGFIPDDPESDLYKRFIVAMRSLALFLQSNGQRLNFETGQESVATLGRFIKDIGTDNLGVHFDPANLLIYDQDAPACLVEQLGRHVAHVHCKDGVRPPQKGILGKEKRLGEGDAGFDNLLRGLYAVGFRGPLIIEREIPPGPEWMADVLHAKNIIEKIKDRLLPR